MSHELLSLDQISAIRPLDQVFSRFTSKLDPTAHPLLPLTAGLLSHWLGRGVTHLPLPQLAETPLKQCFPEEENVLYFPKLSKWIEALQQSHTVGIPGDDKPLILTTDGKLYMKRYWDYESKVQEGLLQLQKTPPLELNLEQLQQSFARLFPPAAETNWQQVAAYLSLTQSLCIISGGPGTGKTSTVVRILAALLEQPSFCKASIALTAPTGKAAARLQESIQRAKKALPISEKILQKIPEEASTLHRLLGAIPHSVYFKYHAEHPLSHQIIIVDEVSMVDLALMSKLVSAVSQGSKLILIGDKEQLCSVEAGNLMYELCEQAPLNQFSHNTCKQFKESFGQQLPYLSENQAHFPLLDHVVHLTKNYRFQEGNGMLELSHAILREDAHNISNLLTKSDWPALQSHPFSVQESEASAFFQTIRNAYQKLFHALTPEDAVRQLEDFQLLCALNEGQAGVHAINQRVERILQHQGWIPYSKREQRWYPGQKIMVTRNHHALNLFNGDLGLIWRSPEAPHLLKAYFQTPQGLRAFPPAMLPSHQTAHALTIHKSQGSEFKHVSIVLPVQPTPLLNKELIYTAITRAQQRVDLFGDMNLFYDVLKNPIAI